MEGFDLVAESHESATEATGVHHELGASLAEHDEASSLGNFDAKLPADVDMPSVAVGAVGDPAPEGIEPTDIATAQAELQNLGYCVDNVDGVLDWNTVNATVEFQEMNDLPMTGFLDDDTLAVLAGEDGDPVPNPLGCGSWDGSPVGVEGPDGVDIIVGEGFEHDGGRWHSEPGEHGWHGGHGHEGGHGG